MKFPHIDELDDTSKLRTYALTNISKPKKGDKIIFNAAVISGMDIVACDKLSYSLTTDWGYSDSKVVSGENGIITFAVDCKDYGEIDLQVIACDADGNPIKGITKFDESVVVEPESFEGLFAAEVKDEAPITINGDEYRMTFIDNFDGTELDTRKWSLGPEQQRHDVGGFWDDSMTSLDGDGNLVISAAISEDGTPISGAIRSLGKFEQARGYFEVRAKLQHAPGFWGAFWLMNREMSMNNTNNNSAKDGVEIDIFESNSYPNGAINNAVHWDGYGANLKSRAYSVKNKDCYDGFHTYAMLWDEDGYTFYIDGEQTWELKGSVPGSCEIPCYMKITAEFGSWAGSIDSKQLPDSLLIDYVKVYERVEK